MSRRGWIYSGVLHLVVIVLAVTGLPSLFEEDYDMQDESISVGVIIDNIAPKVAKVELDKKPDKLIRPELPKPVEMPKLEEKIIKKIPLPKVEPLEVSKKIEKIPDLSKTRPAAITPAALPKAKPNKRPKVEQVAVTPRPKIRENIPKPRPKKIEQQANFDSLLKSVAAEEESPKTVPKFDEFLENIAEVPIPDENEVPSNISAVNRTTKGLSNKIGKLIKANVEANWSVPAGIINAADLVVTIRIRLARDGSVESADILDEDHTTDENFRTMAESARRAVWKASPITALRQFGEDYTEWRDVTFRFRPPV